MEVRCKGKLLPTCLGTYQNHELGLGDLSRGLRRDDGGVWSGTSRRDVFPIWDIGASVFVLYTLPSAIAYVRSSCGGGCMNKPTAKPAKVASGMKVKCRVEQPSKKKECANLRVEMECWRVLCGLRDSLSIW